VDVLEAIKQRRSIRQFTEQAIERELLEQILDAARWAPTASNQQKWRFIVVTDPTVKEMVRKVSPGIFATPAAFIVICAEAAPEASDWDERTYLADCAVAAQNIMLAAHALGLGSCVALSYGRAAVQEILDIPDRVKPELIVTLGYPAEDPSPPPRLPLSQIAFADTYGKGW
jgi:nitroreductase